MINNTKNDIIVVGDISYMFITRLCGDVYVATFDTEDINIIGKFRWFLAKDLAGKFRARTKINNKVVYMHKMVMPNKTHNLCIDHINNNQLDNRKTNLRLVRHAENMQNRKAARTNSSGVRGVSWNSRTKKWATECKVGSIRKYLGEYLTLDEAAEVVRIYRAGHMPFSEEARDLQQVREA